MSFPVKAHKKVIDELDNFEENYLPLLVRDFKKGLDELIRHAQRITPDLFEAYLELTEYAIKSEESPTHFGFSNEINETTIFGLMINERIAFQDIHLLELVTSAYLSGGYGMDEAISRSFVNALRATVSFAPLKTTEKRVVRKALERGYAFYVFHRDLPRALHLYASVGHAKALELLEILQGHKDYWNKYLLYVSKASKVLDNVIAQTLFEEITEGRSYIIQAIYYNSTFQLSSFTDDEGVIALSDGLLQGALDLGFSRYQILGDEYLASSYLRNAIEEIKTYATNEAQALKRFKAFKEVITRGYVDYLVSKNKINPSSILVAEKKYELYDKILEAVLRARERGDLKPQELKEALSREDPEDIKEHLELVYESMMSKGLREAAQSMIDAIANAQTLEDALKLFNEYGHLAALAPLAFSGIGATAFLVPLVKSGYANAVLALLQSAVSVYSLGAAFKALSEDLKSILKFLRKSVGERKRRDSLVYNVIKSNSYALIKALNKVF